MAFSTTMPEATIDKYCDPLPVKNKVRLPKNIFAATPTRNAIHTHNINEPKFGAFIPTRPNACHCVGSAGLTHPIRHGSTYFS